MRDNVQYILQQANGDVMNDRLLENFRMATDRFIAFFKQIYFPESAEMDPILKLMPENLRKFCVKQKLQVRKFGNTSVNGVYHSIVR